MIKKTENGFYICLFGRRYIFLNGKYIGWYNPNLKEVLK